MKLYANPPLYRRLCLADAKRRTAAYVARQELTPIERYILAEQDDREDLDCTRPESGA